MQVSNTRARVGYADEKHSVDGGNVLTSGGGNWIGWDETEVNGGGGEK